MSDKKKAEIMRRRKITEFLRRLPRIVVFFPLVLLSLLVGLVNRTILLWSTRAKHGTIRITSLDKNHQKFVAVTLDALDLIEKYDARRYARLQKELFFITDDPSTAYAAYARDYRECRVNWDGSSFDWAKQKMPTDAADDAPHYTWHLAYYAATLIHEATHGRLHSLGFSHTKPTRVQCERICEAEARRFAAHLPQTEYHFAHDLIIPFDPARWEASWNQSPSQQFKEALHRIRHQGKEAKTNPKEPVEAVEPFATPNAPQTNDPVVELPEWAAPLVRARSRRKKVE